METENTWKTKIQTQNLANDLTKVVGYYAKSHRIMAYQPNKLLWYIHDDLSLVPEEKFFHFFQENGRLEINTFLLLRRINATFQIKTFSLTCIEQTNNAINYEIEISFQVNGYKRKEKFFMKLPGKH